MCIELIYFGTLLTVSGFNLMSRILQVFPLSSEEVREHNTSPFGQETPWIFIQGISTTCNAKAWNQRYHQLTEVGPELRQNAWGCKSHPKVKRTISFQKLHFEGFQAFVFWKHMKRLKLQPATPHPNRTSLQTKKKNTFKKSTNLWEFLGLQSSSR